MLLPLLKFYTIPSSILRHLLPFGFLTLADFFSIISFSLHNATRNTVYFDLYIGGLHDYASIFHLIFDISYLSSTGHVLLLCGVRYLITVYPIHSRQHLTVKAVCFCSLSMWVLCILFAVFAYIMRTRHESYSIILPSIFYLIVLVFVSLIMTSLHVKKNLQP